MNGTKKQQAGMKQNYQNKSHFNKDLTMAKKKSSVAAIGIGYRLNNYG